MDVRKEASFGSDGKASTTKDTKIHEGNLTLSSGATAGIPHFSRKGTREMGHPDGPAAKALSTGDAAGNNFNSRARQEFSSISFHDIMKINYRGTIQSEA
jgi:hypothetical protein